MPINYKRTATTKTEKPPRGTLDDQRFGQNLEKLLEGAIIL